MKYFCDITLLPDAESNLGFLWEKVYTQIHLALVEQQNDGVSNVAISFPKYGDKPFPLGNKLRLISENENDLDNLNLSKWLSRLHDYCHITSNKIVPVTKMFATFRRRQFKTNPERLARRRVKRQGETFEQALSHYKSMDDAVSTLPFIQVKSLSEGSRFKLFIEKAQSDQLVEGEFNCYGLSKTASVPCF